MNTNDQDLEASDLYLQKHEKSLKPEQRRTRKKQTSTKPTVSEPAVRLGRFSLEPFRRALVEMELSLAKLATSNVWSGYSKWSLAGVLATTSLVFPRLELINALSKDWTSKNMPIVPLIFLFLFKHLLPAVCTVIEFSEPNPVLP
ncbi:hypothetical protein C8J56DRAFT_893913 [Mycena floridula]|nr:hypothetical protein C8J56DRAFT_893913 [Mycena floridula]